MVDRTAARSALVRARVAGFLGLVILAAGSLAGILHDRLVVPGDPATTVENLRASASLYRLGIFSGLIMYTVFVFYVWCLYRLLESVDRNQARLMALLALIGVPIAMLNQAHQSAALLLAGDAGYLEGFSPDQIQAQIAFFLELHKAGGLVGAIFWGLWLFPLGLLVYRSGFFPRILGVMLMIGCFGWLILAVQRMLLPGWEVLAQARFAAHVAELSWISWLLFRGLNVDRWEELATEPI